MLNTQLLNLTAVFSLCVLCHGRTLRDAAGVFAASLTLILLVMIGCRQTYVLVRVQVVPSGKSC